MATSRGKTDQGRSGRTKASHSAEPALPPKEADESGAASNLGQLQAMLDLLKGEICTKIDWLSSDLRSDISSVREELRHTIEPLQQKLSSHDQTIAELERASTDHSDQLTTLETSVSTQKQVKLLTDKCEDLEGRTKRNNIRLVGVPVVAEGVQPTEFFSRLLKDILGLEGKPLLDLAHRTLRPKPKEGEQPWPLVIRVHFFMWGMTFCVALERPPKRSPFFTEERSCFSSPTTLHRSLKKCAAFMEVKRQLRSCPGVKFGLRFPAVHMIMLPGGGTHTFEDPAAAMDFVKSKCKICGVF